MKSGVFALACALLAGGAGPLRAVDFVAHRGASHDAPENTLASAGLGWAQGADAVEVDVHLSRDGYLPVIHDPDAKRTTGRDAAIKDLTLAEIRTLDAGRWKDARFAGEGIPTLDQVIALLPPGKRLFVELKTGPEVVPELARCLARTGMSGQTVTIISFNYDTLQEVRRQLPDYPTQYLVGYRKPDPASPPAPPPPTLDELIERARTAGLAGLDLRHTWPLSPADVARIRDAGLQLHVWTVDDPAVAQHWIALGVDSITTNRPGWLRGQLGRPAARTP